jgi:hypothetical protein
LDQEEAEVDEEEMMTTETDTRRSGGRDGNRTRKVARVMGQERASEKGKEKWTGEKGNGVRKDGEGEGGAEAARQARGDSNAQEMRSEGVGVGEAEGLIFLHPFPHQNGRPFQSGPRKGLGLHR